AVSLRSVRFVTLQNCVIDVHGPWTGSNENIEKTAFYVRGGSDIVLEDSEITRTGTAISVNADRVTLARTHIHDITHAGIRWIGKLHSVVEGNLILGLDVGVCTGGAAWHLHCDAIPLSRQGTSIESALRPNSNVTFRGNLMYGVESYSIHFNNYDPFPHIH